MMTYGDYTKVWVNEGEFHQNDPQMKDTFGENSPSVMSKNLDNIGVLNVIPTYENIVPLIDMYSEWWNKVEESWLVYESEKMTIHGTLHWLLHKVIQDPTIDPEILRYCVKNCPKLSIFVVYNHNVPEDLLLSLLDSKSDPTKKTKGGEIGCFISFNKKVSPTVLDKIVRKSKKVDTQKRVIDHPNVTKEILTYLVNSGKSETVKKNALKTLLNKGWVTIS